MMVPEMFDNRQRRAGLLEQGEQQAHGLLDFLVGIENEAAGRVEDQADRRTHPQLPLFRSRQLATEQAIAEPVKFGFTHGAQDAQQQAIRILAGIVDAILINDQGIGQGTDLQQAIPITAGAGQA
jgi:hypothetical protein